MSHCVIQVENMSKRYQLGTIGYGSLQHDLRAWWAKARGKDDPNVRIGEKSRLDQHGEFWALRNITFEVRQGDRVGIIGRNGAGKSTLLKLLSRVTSPTEGSIKARGRIASLLEVGTGFHPELTGRENVFLNGAILGMKRREIQAKFDEIVGFAGVEQFIDTPVKRYSSGMYVRLAFSVAAHLDSEILIIDEVLAVGDAEFQKKCLGKMEDVSRAQGRTILFVSHHLGSVQTLCNKGLFLDKGKVAYGGEIGSCVERYLQSGRPVVRGWTPGSPGKPLRFIRITAMELYLGDSPLKGTLDTRGALSLRIQLDLLERHDLLTLGYSLYSENNELIFRSLATDRDTSFFRGLVPGPHAFQCSVPVEFLKTGSYYINLDASIHHQEWIINPAEDKEYELQFSVENLSFSAMHLPNGVIAPRVDWAKRD